jgi:hypothetical protein
VRGVFRITFPEKARKLQRLPIRARLPSPCITTKVAYHKPIPEKKQPSGMSGMMGAWIQAEKMVQVALVLPCAAFIGWAMGVGLDHLLHQTWISIAGVIFGVIAGLVGVVKMAVGYGSGPGGGGSDANGSGAGDSGTPQ